MRPARAPHRSMRLYLLAVPFLLTIHNVEEVVGGMGATREAISARLPAEFPRLVGSPDAWLFAVTVFTVAPWLLLLLGGLDRPDSALVRTLVVLQAGMALNILSHVGGAIAVRGYVGGLVTAVLLNIPFSALFFRRAWRDGWTSRQFLRWSPVLALLLVPILLALLALGSVIAG